MRKFIGQVPAQVSQRRKTPHLKTSPTTKCAKLGNSVIVSHAKYGRGQLTSDDIDNIPGIEILEKK